MRLKKSQVNKRFRSPEKPNPRQLEQPVVTVSSDAKTLQSTSKNAKKYKYVEYTMQHVDVEELDCPKPGDKMPRAVKENIRKNKKKVRHYYRQIGTDTLALIPR